MLTLSFNKSNLYKNRSQTNTFLSITRRGRHGSDRMVVRFTTTNVPMHSVPITTDVVSSNPDQGEVYNII
jgi:hypothetical protein